MEQLWDIMVGYCRLGVFCIESAVNSMCSPVASIVVAVTDLHHWLSGEFGSRESAIDWCYIL
jgi:hypothetical protein